MDTLSNPGAVGNGTDALAVKVAWFPYMKSKAPTARWLSQVIDDIQNGKWRARIDRLRAIRTEDGEEAYIKAKVKLPSFYVSGTASTPAVMATHSGLITVDLDDLNERLPELRSALAGDPYTAAAFTSPSGCGLKIIYQIAPFNDPLASDEHARAFNAVATYFRQSYGVEVDQSGKNVNRHCLVSFDPGLCRNPQAVPFDWLAYEKQQHDERKKNENSALSSLHSLSSLDSLRSLTFEPPATGGDGMADFEIYDSEPIERAFAAAHPDLARLYQQLLGKRQRPKQRERNQCALDISTFLLRAVDEKQAMLMQGHWYDLYRRGRFNDSREQHLKDAKAHWDNALARYVEELSEQEQRAYLRIPSTDMKAAFRIFRDCALSLRDEPPPQFHMSWKQLSIRLGVSSDRAGDFFDVFARAKIIAMVAGPTMYGRGLIARSTRYRWMLPTP